MDRPQTERSNLLYGVPEPHSELVRAVLPRLEKDGVVVEPNDLLVMSSTRQLLALSVQIQSDILAGRGLVVAVEEPGHHAMFDTIESRGHRLVGVEVDAHGALPASLGLALERGADVVLLTPRALNPTGASWTGERRAALADVIDGHPHALVIEDDYWGDVAHATPGSLIGDPRIKNRTIFVRSFAKSLGPDLRLAVVAAPPRFRTLLRDARLATDGWSSRMSQRVLALLLEDPAMDKVFKLARTAYGLRREAVVEGIRSRFPTASVVPGLDGLNVWVELPHGCDALDVIHHAANLGVLVSSGEAFYTQPRQHKTAIRVSIGMVGREDARRAGELLASAIGAVDAAPLSIVM